MRHTLDERRRAAIPAKWRPDAEDGEVEYVLLLWQSRGQPACVRVLPPDAFDELESEFKQKFRDGDPEGEQVLRSLMARAETATLDGAGRICLPAGLAEAANIQRAILLIGLMNKFEIWDEGTYQKCQLNQADVPALFTQLLAKPPVDHDHSKETPRVG